MTRGNIWGGATKDLAGFNATAGTCSISTSVTRNGYGALRVNPTGAASGYGDFRTMTSAGANTDFNLADSWGRTYIRFDTIPASGSEEFLVLIDSASTRKMSYRVHSDGTISAWDSTGTTQLGSNSSAAVVAGNGLFYECQWKAGSGASAAWELRMDNPAVAGGSATILSGTSSSIGGNLTAVLHGKVINRNSQSIDFYYSDLAVDDTAFPGYGMIRPLIPNDVGFYNVGWSTGAGGGALWELCDETPNDGNTTYMISSAIPDDAITFALPSCASVGIAGPILSVKAIDFSRRLSATGSLHRIRTRINSFDYDGPADIGGGSAYAHKSYMMTLNPEDSAAFEVADLDATEVGGVEKSATQACRVTLVLLEVEYAPPHDVGARTVPRSLAAAAIAAIATVGALAFPSSRATASPLALASVGARTVCSESARASPLALALVGAQGIPGSTARSEPTALALVQARGLASSSDRSSPLASADVGALARSGSTGIASPLALALVEARASALSLAFADRALIYDVGARSISGTLARAVAAGTAPSGFYEGTANLVRTRASGLSLAPVFYDDQPDSAKPQDSPWIGLAVEFEGTDQVMMVNQYRAHGSARFGVRVPATLGDRDALRIADEIRTEFTGARGGATGVFGDIIYGAPEIDLGELEGSWWLMEVVVPFRRDRTEAPQAGSGGFPALEAVGNIARTRFKTLVTDAHPCETLWENQPGDIPTTSPWAHFSVRNDRIHIVAYGPPSRYRVHGTVTAELFASLTEGDRDQLRLADRIDIAFRAVTDQGVTFETPELHTIGLENGWWRINVRCPFYSEFFVS